MKNLFFGIALCLTSSAALADVGCVSLCIVNDNGERKHTVTSGGSSLSEALSNLNAACDKIAGTGAQFPRIHYLATSIGNYGVISSQYASPEFTISDACIDQVNLP